MRQLGGLRHSVTWLAIVLACVSYGALAAITGTTSYHWTRTPSNRLDSRHQDGNDGTAATPLTWSTVANLSLSTGVTGSRNDRAQYLTEAGSPTATLTLSCTPALPSAGFSATADGISWSSTTSYSGVCQWSANRSGTIALSSTFTVSATAPPGSDTTAPIIPTGCTIANGTGNFTLNCDASSDPYDGSTPSGVATYEICLNGAGCVTTPAVASVQPQLSFTNIGSLSPTPTCTQNGADWQCVAAGTADGTADAMGFQGVSVTGDFCATVKVTSLSVTADYGKGEVQVREAAAANSRKFESVITKLLSGTYYWNLSHRVQDGGSRGSITTVNPIASPAWEQICRVGSTFSGSYSVNGNDWLSNRTDSTVGFSNTVLVGQATTATTGGGGATATANYAQWNLTAAPRWSYTYTTSSSGTVTVRANDVAGNHSAYNTVGTATPSTPADVTAPTRTVQPATPGASAVTTSSITWDLGTCTDASGIRGYIPYTKTSSGGTRTTQTEQSVNSYTQSGLSASTTYYLDVKCVDNAANPEASFSTEVSATTASSGGNPASAPTISTFTQHTDRSASYTLTHSLVTNSDHYNVQVADCADDQTPGTYTTIGAYQHTTATTTLTGFAISDSKSIRVQAADAANSVVFASSATACVKIYDPWSQAFQLTSGDYVEIYSIADGSSQRAQATTAFNLTGRWKGVMRAQLQLGMFEAPLSGQATTHSTANPVTGAGYEHGAEVMNFYSAAAGAKAKKFIMMLSDKVHGNYGAISPELFPQYFKTDAAYDNPSDPADNGGYFVSEVSQGSSGWTIYGRVWVPLVAASYADAAEWMCRHYDGDPNWEGLQLASVSIPNFETSSSFPHSGYTWAAYIAGVKTILVRARQYCPHKDISIRLDWPTGGLAEARAFWKWARGYRISASNFDTVDFVGRTGSVAAGTAGSEGETYGYGGLRGAAVNNGPAGVASPDLRDAIANTGGVESFDWVRAFSRYKIASIDEFFDIAKYYKYRRLFWTADDFSCGPDSSFTPTNLGKTNSTGTNCPGSGTTIWSLIQQCMSATVDQPAIGCTIATRDQALTATCPSDWVGCTP